MTKVLRQLTLKVSVFSLSLIIIKLNLDLVINEKESSGNTRNFQNDTVFRSRQSVFLKARLDNRKRLRNTYIVDTPYCKIPNVHPFHPSIRKFIKILEPARCVWNTSLVYQSGQYLVVNWTAARLPPYNNNVTFCTYRPLYRPNILQTHKNFLWFGKESAPFSISTEVPHEFVRVNCFDALNNNIYFNFHAFVQKNAHLDKFFKRRLRVHMKENVIKKYLNVMLIGIDSLSRLSFMRQMRKTRAFIRENLAAVDMNGYNKVGDNTFANIVPLALGKFMEEVPWNRDKTFDGFEFIWKQFADRGYRTHFAEDRPDISTFEYTKKGFSTPPSEHYYRPMSIAMFREKYFWSKNHACFQDRLEAEIILNYTYDFIETYKNQAYFSFTFISGLTHENQNGASSIDHIYYKFFSRLFYNSLIQNTIIFFFSDHGMRYGTIREAFVGKLEERLPLMYIIIPKWLRGAYPNLTNVLRVNKNRLATPFDVYKTLRDILYFNGSTKPDSDSTRGVSWFREIPETRTCETAGIMPHWCTCLQHCKLQTNDIEAIYASNEVLKEINILLSPHETFCEKLSIYQIKDATRTFEANQIIMGSKKKLSDITYGYNLIGKREESTEYVQVTVETVPGHALFEATVRVELHKDGMLFELVGDISRINLYMSQSFCVDDFRLKKFCFCKI